MSLTLEPPDPQNAPDAGLVGERSIPAGADGFSGTTTIEVIHDPGHILLPGLQPA